MKRKRQNYSLIEILAVMAIATVMFAVGAPSFMRLFGSGGVAFAASQLKVAIDQARSIAISNRRYVALVIDAKGYNDKYPNQQAIRPCFVDPDEGVFSFVSWVPDYDWSPIADNIIIIRYTNDAPASTSTSTGLDASDYTWDNFTKCKVLDDSGNLSSNNVDGICLITIDSTEYNSIVFSTYGALSKLPTVYFTLSEGALIGNTFIHKNNIDGDIFDYVTISVNRFTGKTEYEQ